MVLRRVLTCPLCLIDSALESHRPFFHLQNPMELFSFDGVHLQIGFYLCVVVIPFVNLTRWRTILRFQYSVNFHMPGSIGQTWQRHFSFVQSVSLRTFVFLMPLNLNSFEYHRGGVSLQTLSSYQRLSTPFGWESSSWLKFVQNDPLCLSWVRGILFEEADITWRPAKLSEELGLKWVSHWILGFRSDPYQNLRISFLLPLT